MTDDKKLNAAAKEFYPNNIEAALSKHLSEMDRKYNPIQQANMPYTISEDAFKAGAAWQAERCEKLVEALRSARDFCQDSLARTNAAIATDCPNCDYQCVGCIRNVDDCEYTKKIIIKALAEYEGEK